MTELKHPSKIRVIEPMLTLALFAIVGFYLLNAFNTGNWLWFRGGIADIEPSRIVIIDHGERLVVQPGSPNFSELSDATALALSKFTNTDLINIGLSEETLQNYEDSALLVEVYFNSPVQFNTMVRTGEPTQLLIPIDGRHAGSSYVFRGAQGEWWFGAIRMADPQPLYQVLQQMGYTADLFEVEPTS
ncbi:MAG: hypothetical protein AAF490_12735 [Chloroflexota bacterium]